MLRFRCLPAFSLICTVAPAVDLMPCHHCTSARRASRLALQAIAEGDIREGATRAKEAAAHIKAKLRGDDDGKPAIEDR